MSSENLNKATLLFNKGMNLYNEGNYEEALKYFEASYKFNPTNNTEIYINTCKKVINKKQEKKNSSNYTNSSSNTSYTQQNNQSNSQQKPSSDNSSKTDEDRECENVINEKDFYKVLGIEKSASPEEIKKAYKKKAIKFHPDKNHSSKAEEAFKKISHAYQILSDKDKKDFYDNHGGTEEEVRAQYQARYHQNYYNEDIDPFDVFEMFFGPGFAPGMRRGRRNQNTYYNFHQEPVQLGKYAKLMQLLPIFMIFITFILPNIIEFMKPVSRKI